MILRPTRSTRTYTLFPYTSLVRSPRQVQGRPVPADGLWPPRLQKLRPARDRDAENGARGVRRAEGQRPGVRRSAPARGNGAERRLFRRAETVPESRFLFGRHPVVDWFPDDDVHRDRKTVEKGQSGSDRV